MKLKDYIKNEKPREKLEEMGVEHLSDSELLSILIRTGNKNESVNELSNRILKEEGSLLKLSELSLNRLCSIEGIKLSKATTLLAAFEIGKRIFRDESKRFKLKSTADIYNYFKGEFINAKQEKFFVLLFDTKMNLINKIELFKGTVDNVNVHPREVFRMAIKESASFIIVMHNHPSGDTSPSSEDIEITNRLIEASKIIGIKFLDHIIISSDSYYSFYAENSKN